MDCEQADNMRIQLLGGVWHWGDEDSYKKMQDPEDGGSSQKTPESIYTLIETFFQRKRE